MGAGRRAVASNQQSRENEEFAPHRLYWCVRTDRNPVFHELIDNMTKGC